MNTGISYFDVEGGKIGLSWDMRSGPTTIYVIGSPASNPPIPMTDTLGNRLDIHQIALWSQVSAVIESGALKVEARRVTSEEIETAAVISVKRRFDVVHVTPFEYRERLGVFDRWATAFLRNGSTYPIRGHAFPQKK